MPVQPPNANKAPVILVSMNVAPVGGLTNDVLKCIRALRASDREVHVIYGFRGEGTLDAVPDPEVQWHRVYMLKRPPVIGQIMLWSISALTIRKIKRKSPNAKVICFDRLPLGDATIGTAPHALWLAVRKQMQLSRFSKIPYTLWCNWMDSKIQKHPTRDIVIFSRRDQQALLDRGVAESRLHRVIIPTDTERFRPLVKSERNYITIIGANPTLKGIDLVLKAWPEIHRYHPELKLRIVTQGWKVKRLVEKTTLLNVEIADFIIDVESYYHTSRLILMPSMFETWGNVIPEALACGIPVVASSSVPACELITSENLGLVFKRELATDRDDFLAAIEHALKLSMDIESMSERHQAVEHFMSKNNDLVSWLCNQGL
jgi:glycosyltransferase involved in cell wall biosynthesis